MINIPVKKKEDLVHVFGAKVAATISKSMRRDFMKRNPFSVAITKEKPAFYLDDGGMLRAYAVDLATGKILAEKYCGSADSAIMHEWEQFGKGHKAPGEVAIFFVETYPSSGNHPWNLTVVSNNLIEQISNKTTEG